MTRGKAKPRKAGELTPSPDERKRKRREMRHARRVARRARIREWLREHADDIAKLFARALRRRFAERFSGQGVVTHEAMREALDAMASAGTDASEIVDAIGETIATLADDEDDDDDEP